MFMFVYDDDVEHFLTIYALFADDTVVQWNLSVTTTSIIKLITCDLFSNVF